MLPPEINSGRIYSGPGPGPMLAAAAAWDEIATELQLAATGYASVISELTSSQWLGASARAMLSAVSPYIDWLNTTAAEAEITASQAGAAVAAYEMVFTLVVPPPVIAANRVLLMTLAATNFFGQNTPALAATEADYLEMWAQDAAAMYGYAASCARATKLAGFSPPARTTDPGVAPAASVPSSPQSLQATIPHMLSAAARPQAARLVAAPPADAAPPDVVFVADTAIGDIPVLGWLPTPENNWAGLYPGMYSALKQALQAYYSVGIAYFGSAIGQQLFPGLGTTAGSGGAWYPTPQYAALGAGGWQHHGPAGVSAGAASSAKIGGMSVPPSWVHAPGAHHHGIARDIIAASGHTDSAHGLDAALGGFPVETSGGRRADKTGVRYGLRYTVLSRPLSAG